MSAELQLIIGGARSGKSRLAEKRALASGLHNIHLATATADDSEMTERIKRHRDRRDASWQVVEEPLMLAKTLEANTRSGVCIVVDCLTLWLSNCLHHDCWDQQKDALLDCLDRLEGMIIFVSNEVGLGVVPIGEITREFVDQSGFFHQDLARACQRVTFCVAGLSHELKQTTDHGGLQ